MGWTFWDGSLWGWFGMRAWGDGTDLLRWGLRGWFGMRGWGDRMDVLGWEFRGMVWDEGLGRWDGLVEMGV